MAASSEGEPSDAAPRIELVEDGVRWRPIVGIVAALIGLLAATIAVVVARVPPYAGLFDWMGRIAGPRTAGGAVFIAVSATLLVVLAGAEGLARFARRPRDGA